VPVDDRAWGVYIEVSAELFTDVWIDEGLWNKIQKSEPFDTKFT
jgi:hypothetical protein